MSHFTVLIDVPHESHLDFQVADVLEPFYEQTEDKDYLEFIDKTAEIQDDYLNKTADCIQTPDGRFLPQYHAALRGLVIKDGTPNIFGKGKSKIFPEAEEIRPSEKENHLLTT